MANPWEEYAASPASSATPAPWEEYGGNTSVAAPPVATPAAAAPQQSTWDKIKPYITSGNPIEDLKTGVKLAAHGIVQGATTTSGMLADLPYQVANLFGANKQLPTQAQTQMLDNVIGKPVGPMANAINLAGNLLGGGLFDPAMQAAQAAIPKPLYTPNPQLTGPGMNAQTINNAMDAGVKVTPSTSPNSGIGSQTLETLAGPGTLKTAMQNRNRAVYDALANKIIGNPAGTTIDDSTVNQAIGNTYANGYDPIAALPKLTTGKVYRQALDQVASQAPDLKNIVDAYRTPALSGQQAIDWIKTLRRNAADVYASNAPNKGTLGDTYKGIANALENNIGLNLPPDSNILNNYTAARQQIAQQYAIKKAIVDGTGSINAANIGAQLAAGSKNGGVSPFTGNLAMIGNLAKAAPTVAKFPTGTAPPIDLIDKGMLGWAAHNAMNGDFGSAAMFGAGGLARPAIRQLLLSPAYQNMFLRPSVAPGAVNQFLQNPNVQKTVPAFINSGLFGNQ